MSDNDNKNTSLENLDWGLGKVVWAKTNMKDPDDLRWSSLAQHSIDTALVAGKVWNEFLPDAVKNVLPTYVGLNPASAGFSIFLNHEYYYFSPGIIRLAS